MVGTSMGRCSRHAACDPTRKIDSQEIASQKKDNPSSRTEAPNIAEPAHQTGPQQAHLEAESVPLHCADREHTSPIPFAHPCQP